jgi:hypothetical protein
VPETIDGIFAIAVSGTATNFHPSVYQRCIFWYVPSDALGICYHRQQLAPDNRLERTA